MTATERSDSVASLKVLDVCSGAGGWSAAFRDRGHEVRTIDVHPRFQPTYLVDLRTFDPHMMGDWRPDVVLFSPPCQRFSTANAEKVALPIEPEDLFILSAGLRLIRFLKPKFWAIENVKGAEKYFRPWLGEPTYQRLPHLIWSNAVPTIVEDAKFGKGYVKSATGNFRVTGGFQKQIGRSKIPYPISKAFCDAMEDRPDSALWNPDFIVERAVA